MGEAGAGKTALWRNGVGSAQARGYRTLVARPVEIETTLSFAGLVDLLEPSLEEALGGLPQPQREALEVAFLLKPAREAPARRCCPQPFLKVSSGA
jgi:hypothetical protein